MIVINVFFHIKQEQKAAYLTAMDELVSQSNKEEGAIFYNLFSDPKDDTRYIIVENWQVKQPFQLITKPLILKHLLAKLIHF